MTSRSAASLIPLTALLAALGACGGGGDAGDRPDAAQPAPDPTVVRIGEGSLQGKQVGTTRLFLGIPYAEPPVGPLRFAAPLPVASWEGVKQAVAHGPSCVQSASLLSAQGDLDEDCLSLNVYAPERGEKLPVMVWLHGGAFVTGGSVQYDGVRLVSEGDLIVVTVNYRLGALGFFSHPQLDQVRTGAPSGNDGIRDQQVALRWVQRNIAAFGGDPDNVTLVGESAGASSACTHLVSADSRGLARRFVLESGVCIAGLPVSDKARADALGERLAAALCPDAADRIACLRAKPATEVFAWGADHTTIGAGWNPVFNAADPLLPEHPLTLLLAGKHNPGEILLGSNKNEWGLFVLLSGQPPITTRAAFEASVEAQWGKEISARIAAQYAPTDADANTTFVRMMTDAVFRCPARGVARLASVQGAKVYLYSFEEGLALHAYEVPYVFGNATQLIPGGLVEPLRQTMQSYWRAFVKRGDPNVEGQPTWPAFELATDSYMVLKAGPEVKTGLSSAECAFWEQLSGSNPLPPPHF